MITPENHWVWPPNSSAKMNGGLGGGGRDPSRRRVGQLALLHITGGGVCGGLRDVWVFLSWGDAERYIACGMGVASWLFLLTLRALLGS